jgi:hypothetical protein
MSVSGKNKGKTNSGAYAHPTPNQAIPGKPGQYYPASIAAALNPYYRPYAPMNAENNQYLDENGQA